MRKQSPVLQVIAPPSFIILILSPPNGPEISCRRAWIRPSPESTCYRYAGLIASRGHEI